MPKPFSSFLALLFPFHVSGLFPGQKAPDRLRGSRGDLGPDEAIQATRKPRRRKGGWEGIADLNGPLVSTFLEPNLRAVFVSSLGLTSNPELLCLKTDPGAKSSAMSLEFGDDWCYPSTGDD